MTASINRAILLGVISRHGVEMRFTDKGTPHATFMLVLTETGSDGKEHQTWLPCEVWGKGAEKAGELEAGQCVVFESKLRRVKKGESWDTIIAGFEVTPVTLPTAMVP
jgi:single-stranded DNA-binding protein